MPIPTIEWKNNKARIIDQTALPNKLAFKDCSDEKDIYRAIKSLEIRGAPAIGIAGAFGMYLGLRNKNASDGALFLRKAEQIEKYLASSRPTARNLFWALERMKAVCVREKGKAVKYIKKALFEEALLILEEDKRICRDIGKHGDKLIKSGDTILTHCNAGGLATADYGTALAVIYRAHEQGKKIRVFADETRPVLQGSRLTAWELKREGVDVTLICDNMAASLMAKKKIDKIIVGADRIAQNGDVANKIGTYNVAVLAGAHRIPFYVAAPVSTFDFRIKAGKDIVIEERDGDEIRKTGSVYTAPKNIKVYNPAFDVTPHNFITAIITEYGVIKNPSPSSMRAFRQKVKNERA